MLHDSPSLLEALPGHPGNPRTRIEGESPPQEKGHTVFVADAPSNDKRAQSNLSPPGAAGER